MQFNRTVVSLGLSAALVLTGCGITEGSTKTPATEDPAQ